MQAVDEGKFDLEAYFGGVPPDELEEAFLTFDAIKREIGDTQQIMIRKSSAGPFYNKQSIYDDKKHYSGDSIAIAAAANRAALMLSTGNIGAAEFDMVEVSSSDDDGGDEAVKFVQQTIKNTFLKNNGSKLALKNEKNLLLKTENDEDEEDYGQEEEDYNRRTPKMMDSGDEGEEECNENRVL